MGSFNLYVLQVTGTDKYVAGNSRYCGGLTTNIGKARIYTHPAHAQRSLNEWPLGHLYSVVKIEAQILNTEVIK